MRFSTGAKTNFIHCFTDRVGGVGKPPFEGMNFGFLSGDEITNVDENYRLLTEEMKLNKPILTCKQVHKTDIAEVTKNHGAIQIDCNQTSGIFNPVGKNYIYAQIKADAIYTEEKGLPVGVYTADCLPIIISDDEGSFIMAIHAGWRGVVAGIIEKSLELLRERKKQNLEIILGPAIGKCCLELKNESELFDPSSVTERGNSFYIDLKHEVANKIKKVSNGKFQLHNIDHCTCCEKDLFYSYRRDKTTGRHLNFGYLP